MLVGPACYLVTVAGHITLDKFVIIHDIDLSYYGYFWPTDCALACRECSYLFPHSDVPLPDQNSGVMDGLGQSQLENLTSKMGLEGEKEIRCDVLHWSFRDVCKFHQRKKMKIYSKQLVYSTEYLIILRA